MRMLEDQHEKQDCSQGHNSLCEMKAAAVRNLYPNCEIYALRNL